MVHNLFPSTEKLKNGDKGALLRNFIPKLWLIDPVLDYIRNFEEYDAIGQSDLEKLIIDFYKGVFLVKCSMSDEDIIRTFSPIWSFYFFNLIQPIISMKLEEPEFMAIVWLMFFDSSYSNISDECLEMCRNIRKIVLRELRNYQIDINCGEKRFLKHWSHWNISKKEIKN